MALRTLNVQPALLPRYRPTKTLIRDYYESCCGRQEEPAILISRPTLFKRWYS